MYFRAALVGVAGFGLVLAGLGVIMFFFEGNWGRLVAVVPVSLASVTLGFHYLITSLLYFVFKPDYGWVCSCPACRLWFRGSSQHGSMLVSSGVDLEVPAGFQNVEGSTAGSPGESGSSSGASPSEDGSSKRSEEAGDERYEALAEALSKIRDEITNFKGAVEGSLKEITDSLIALKSEVDESKNPFNVMRSVSDFLDEDTRRALLLVTGNVEGGDLAASSARPMLGGSRVVEASGNVRGEPPISRLIELIIGLDEIYETSMWPKLKELVETLSESGILRGPESSIIKFAVNIVEKSRSSNVNVRDYVKALYIMSRYLGLRDGESAFIILDLITGGEKGER